MEVLLVGLILSLFIGPVLLLWSLLLLVVATQLIRSAEKEISQKDKEV